MPFKIIQKQPPKESTIGLETAYRIPAVAATGVASAIPGVFGDIAKTVNDLLLNPASKKGLGRELPSYEQSTLGKILPTTAQHKKTIEKNIPFLKPKNHLEKFSQNIAEDTASLFLPGKYFKMGKYAFSPYRSLAIATSANIGGKGTELWTGDKSKGDMVKSGMMLFLSFLNPTYANNIKSNLFSSADNLLPQNATVPSISQMTKLNTLENKILQGRPAANVAASEKFVLDEINKFRKLDQNGQMNMRSLVAQKRSFNEELSNNLFELTDRSSKARARELATEISHATRDTMRQYGQTNPQWLKYQEAADKAHGAIAESNYISRILEKFMKGRPEGLAHLFGITLPTAGAYFSPLGTGAAVSLYQATKIAARAVKSPELRKHYAKVVGAASADNPKLIHKELDELEDKLEKEQDKSKNKFKIIQK